MKRRFILPLVFASAVAGWWLFRPERVIETRPIQEYPEAQFVGPADYWSWLHDPASARETGWVRLPTEQPDALHVPGPDPYELGYVDSKVCAECHSEQFQGYAETAHYRTSGEATLENVLGRFADGQNQLDTSHQNFHFRMTAEADGPFQELFCRSGGREFRHAERIDVVTGSGNHGQTYLYWRGDALFQLPVSYFTELDRWITSPGGYFDGTADFARPIAPRCLDCHATYIEHLPGSLNRYVRAHAVWGVGCVRCHGRGREHVEYHRSNPLASEARHITNPASLDRDHLNAICAQCHSGGTPLKPAFSYQPGEPLQEYLRLDLSAATPHNADPHSANQLARLMQSRCFQRSEDLSCATCHNPHQHERGRLALFAERCAACHEPSHCGEVARTGPSLESRCVECHMPSTRDRDIEIAAGGTTVSPLLRDHYIKVWPGISRRVLRQAGAANTPITAPAK